MEPLKLYQEPSKLYQEPSKLYPTMLKTDLIPNIVHMVHICVILGILLIVRGAFTTTKWPIRRRNVYSEASKLDIIFTMVIMYDYIIIHKI